MPDDYQQRLSDVRFLDAPASPYTGNPWWMQANGIVFLFVTAALAYDMARRRGLFDPRGPRLW